MWCRFLQDVNRNASVGGRKTMIMHDSPFLAKNAIIGIRWYENTNRCWGKCLCDMNFTQPVIVVCHSSSPLMWWVHLSAVFCIISGSSSCHAQCRENLNPVRTQWWPWHWRWTVEEKKQGVGCEYNVNELTIHAIYENKDNKSWFCWPAVVGLWVMTTYLYGFFP